MPLACPTLFLLPLLIHICCTNCAAAEQAAHNPSKAPKYYFKPYHLPMNSIRLQFPARRLSRALFSLPTSRSLSSTAGDLFVSGSSSTGQLGIASASKTKGLEPVPLPEPVTHVALGTFHALAVGVSGALYGWGGGVSGQNGHGFNTQVDQPKLIKAAAGVRFTAVAAGKMHSLALSRRAPFPPASHAHTLFCDIQTKTCCHQHQRRITNASVAVMAKCTRGAPANQIP
jgi:hypothetical protein